ncbi:MAG: D-aminoacyl-tRNA deacylase [Candidatus Micrarchaeota archaeon]
MACLKKNLVGSILYSTKNLASQNIISHLEKEWNWKKESEKLFSFSACGKEKCCTGLNAYGFDAGILDIEPEEGMDADYFLYASSHKSEAGTKSLTVHFPGNWGNADLGGENNTLNIAYACKLKQILKFLKEGTEKEELGWEVSMEVDHHGPTPEDGKKVLVFVEIGSKEEEWKNEIAGKIVANAMMKSLVRKCEEFPAYIGIGGGHYAPKFSQYVTGEKLLDGKEIAIGHILPKYHADEISGEMLKQAVEKNVEKIVGVLVDWKGLNKEQKEKIIPLLEKNNVKWERA